MVDETLKLIDLDPDGTVTLAGTEAAGLLLINLTENPADAAGPVRVTVPVEANPPITEVGLTETPARAVGTIVALPLAAMPESVAVTLAETVL